MNSTFAPALSLLTSLMAISFSSLNSQLYTLPPKIIKLHAFSLIKNHVSNDECASDLRSVVSAAFNSELWALKMLDASSKMNSGLLNGNVNFIGDFDQCLSISETVNARTVSGQYCTLIVTVHEEVLGFLNFSSDIKTLIELSKNKVREIKIGDFQFASKVSVPLGVCVPKSCSNINLENLARGVERKYGLPVQTTVIEELCTYKGKSVEITESDVYIYSFFITVLFIIVSSTIYDSYLRSSGQVANFFVIFSAYTNLEKLFSVSVNNLSCLNGIKVLSCCWVILAHVALFTVGVAKNPLDVLTTWIYCKPGIFVWSASYSVTTFFTISGFLVSYIYLKYSDKISVNLLSFYLARFVRLTPAFLAAIFVQASIIKLLADGPYGNFLATLFKENCHPDWWRIFFYFVNFTTKPDHCILHTWYLTVDSQLYLWAPIILFFIKKYPKTVLTGMTLAFITGIIYTTVVTVSKRLGISIFDWNNEFRDSLYLSVHYHLPSWLIGVVLGYMLHQKKIQIGRNLNLVLWILSIYVMYALIFDQIVFVAEEYNIYRAAIWNGLSKPLWSLCLSFIIFSCATDNGGVMNTFLSHPVFTVLGRLSYSIYLIHMSVAVIIFASKTETFYFGYFYVMTEFFRIFFISLVCSLFLYLGFEAPIMALNYHLHKNGKRKDS